MKSYNPYRLCSLLGLLIMVVLTGCAKRDGVLKIGCAAPITGDQAKIGLDLLNGVKLAVEEANQKGEVIPGYKLSVYEQDDQHNPAQAVSVAKKFIADRDVVAVVGHLNSSCTKPASSVYYEARIVQVSPASTNPEISKQGFDTFFRTCTTDDVQGPAGAVFAVGKLGVQKVYVIDDRTTYGKGLADEFHKKAEILGAKILGHEGITQGDKDFTPLLTKIKALMPDLIFFGGIYPEGALLIKQARNLDMKCPFMGGDGMYDTTLIKLATPQAAEGTYITFFGADMEQLPTAKEFVLAYKAKYGEIGPFSTYAYDAANIVIEAIKRAGKKDRAAVLAEVKKTKDFHGAIGVTNFDARGDTLNKMIGIFQASGDRFQYIGPAEP